MSALYPWPRVTVVIPTYDGATRVADAIRSVHAQHYPNLQVIVVDDGSEPPLRELVPSLPRSDVELIRLDKNMGAYAARNAALDRARGEIIAFLDDDDLWIPDSLTGRLEVLERSPTALMVHASVIDHHPNGATTLRRAEDTDLRKLLIRDCIATSTVLVRKRTLGRVGRFDGSLRRFGDWDLWIRIAQVGPIARWDAVAAHVRVRPGSLQHGDIHAIESARGVILRRYEGLQAALGVREQALAYSYGHLAGRYYKAGRRRESRKAALRSLGARFNLRGFAVLLLSLLPVSDTVRAYSMVRRIHRSVAGRSKLGRLFGVFRGSGA